jgi:hypothetical protein
MGLTFEELKETCLQVVTANMGKYPFKGVYIWNMRQRLIARKGTIADNVVRFFLGRNWYRDLGTVGATHSPFEDTFIIRVTDYHVVMVQLANKEHKPYAMINLQNRINAFQDFYQLPKSDEEILINMTPITLKLERDIVKYSKNIPLDIELDSPKITAFIIADREQGVVYEYVSPKMGAGLNIAREVEHKIREAQNTFGETQLPASFNLGGQEIHYQLTENKTLFACMANPPTAKLDKWLQPLVAAVLNHYEKTPITPQLDSYEVKQFMEAYLKYILLMENKPAETQTFLFTTFFTPTFYRPLKFSFGPVKEAIFARIKELYQDDIGEYLDPLIRNETPISLIEAIKMCPAKWKHFEDLHSHLWERGLIKGAGEE